jgi:hypothetical protein
VFDRVVAFLLSPAGASFLTIIAILLSRVWSMKEHAKTLEKQQQTLNVIFSIQRQTNGATTLLENRIALLHEKLEAANLATISPQAIQTIEAIKDTLAPPTAPRGK